MNSLAVGDRAALSLLIGLFLLGSAPLTGIGEAAAQSPSETLSLVIPSVMRVEPGTETLLPIQITPSGAAPRRAMVLIRGLPQTIALSGGRLFESGVWSVPVGDLNGLRIFLPVGARGQNDLSISVVTIDGNLLAEAASSLVIAEASVKPNSATATPNGQTVLTAAPPAASPRPAAPQPQSAATPTQRLTPETRDALTGLVKKGDENMRTGNVVAARLLYRHAAENGLAAGALAMASTFDEVELARLRVRGGVQADPKEAKVWYDKARALGAVEAEERLQRLGAR